SDPPFPNYRGGPIQRGRIRNTGQLPTGETGDLVAIFDNPTSTSELGAAGFLASAPSVTVPTSALPVGFGEGAILTIKGAEYLVAHEPEPDGEGVSVVTLERAEP
uniref:head-tail joining protein n=1 Tax=Roseibium sediminis TaxID=1775174 RepID=UPI00195AA7CB